MADAIMILYENTTAKVRSPDGDTEFFEILAGVLQGDTIAPYLFIICLDYNRYKCSSHINRPTKTPGLSTEKTLLQEISCNLCNRRWLCWWPSVSFKYHLRCKHPSSCTKTSSFRNWTPENARKTEYMTIKCQGII